MRIAGLVKNSFVDYPGKVAAVLFTPGCNMDCFYCHNRILLGDNIKNDLMDEGEILRFLKSRRGFLDGVVITGGEPTLQPGLNRFVAAVKEIGYSVKLDSNGTNPEVLKALIAERLVDYAAMDIKTSLPNYRVICRTEVDIGDIQKSMDLLLQGEVDYEFRTTLAPQLGELDLLSIGERIRGARLYVLQKMRIPQEEEFPGPGKYNVDSSFIQSVASKLGEFVQRCETRGF